MFTLKHPDAGTDPPGFPLKERSSGLLIWKCWWSGMIFVSTMTIKRLDCHCGRDISGSAFRECFAGATLCVRNHAARPNIWTIVWHTNRGCIKTVTAPYYFPHQRKLWLPLSLYFVIVAMNRASQPNQMCHDLWFPHQRKLLLAITHIHLPCGSPSLFINAKCMRCCWYPLLFVTIATYHTSAYLIL